MKTQSFFKTLFFPLLLLFNLMGLGAFLFQQGSHLLIPSGGLAVRAYTLISSIVFSIGFILIMSRLPARQAFSKALGSLSLFLGCALTLLFFNTTAPYFYLLTSFLSPLLFPLLIWAFVNQVASFAESIKYYIALTFLSGLSTAAFSVLNIRLGETPLEQGRIFIAGATLCVLLSWVIYRRLITKLPEERWLSNGTSPKQTTTVLPIFKIGFAIAAFGILNSFLNVVFKTQVHNQLSSPVEYAQFMGTHSMRLGIGVLTLSVASLMGTFVLQRKGWRFTAFLTPFAVFAIILLFGLGIAFNFYPLQLGTITQILTNGLNMGLLFPLIQMVYLSIHKESRFKTQLWAELLIAPFFLGVAPLIMQGLLVLFGTVSAISPYLLILAFLTTAALATVIYSLSKRNFSCVA
jgi:AAA family ATP:ADP antiporter